MVSTIKNTIFHLAADTFEAQALDLFHYQAKNNPVYAKYLSLLGCQTEAVTSVIDIPFLPVEFFKTHTILCAGQKPEKVFSSSGTTGTVKSKHYVSDLAHYRASFREGFKQAYGPVEDLCLLALLPAYLECEDSSLVYMIEDLITQSNHPKSGFYLHNLDELAATLGELEKEGQPTLLLGVSYALLDLVEKYGFNLQHTEIMETGGMKGKRQEMVREELHHKLSQGFGVKNIYSEYGMTELLSQAYSKGKGLFTCPPWMRVLVRDINDPRSYLGANKMGGLNLIDLANSHSCSFIASQDLGKSHADGRFEVLGRFDQSDIRGCNLLVL